MEIPIDDAGGGADSTGSMTSRTQTPDTAWMLVFACWAVATAATLGALFFSEVMELPPCALCWYQRIAMFPLVLILAAGLFPFDLRVIRYALPLTVPLAVAASGFFSL